MGTSRRHLRECPCRCVGLAGRVRAPAGDRAVGSYATGMGTSCRHLRECPCRCVGLAEIVKAPAGDRAVGSYATGMGTSRRHLRKCPCRCVGLAVTVIAPAGDRAVGSYATGKAIISRVDLFECAQPRVAGSTCTAPVSAASRGTSLTRNPRTSRCRCASSHAASSC